MNHRYLGLVAVVLLLSICVPALAAQYVLDVAHTQIGFEVKHLTITTVTGRFDKFEGAVDFDDAKIGDASASVVIDVASVNTGVEKRDDHLRTADFFDAATHPTMTFQSKKVKDVKGNKFKVEGELTLHGVTKDVTLDGEFIGKVDDPWGNERIGFEARGEISRRDFNIAPETANALVGDTVKLVIHVEAMRPKEGN